LENSVDCQFCNGELYMAIFPYEELKHTSMYVGEKKEVYPLLAVEPEQMPAQPSKEKEECIFMPPSVFFHLVHIYITQDHP